MIRQAKAVPGFDRACFVVEASDVRLIPGCRRKELPLGPQGPATNSKARSMLTEEQSKQRRTTASVRGFLGPPVILFTAEPLILFRAKLFLQIPAPL